MPPPCSISKIYKKRKSVGHNSYIYVFLFLSGYQVAKPVSGFDREHTNGRTCHHVAPVMAVASNAVDGSNGGHGESCHAYPRTHLAKLLMQYGGPAEGYRRMARRKRMVVGAVRARRMYGMLQRLGYAGVDDKRRGRIDKQTLPRTLGVNPCCLEHIG